jgi:hypothetical protein
MMAERLILIRHSSALRAVTDKEVLATLSADDLPLAREIVSVDTTPFAEEAAAGDWDRSERYLRERAAAILQLANGDARASELRYFGLAEIPDVIALGAFLGDERYVRVIDYDRHGEEWAWPETDQTLSLTTTPLPMERLTQPGIAVLRVSASALISDADAEAAVGRESLADVTIGPAEGAPKVGLVRSLADVEHVRSTFRSALSAIIAARPGVEVIHLFVAAPVSACFVIGQELHLRSTVPVLTYRFRKAEGETAYVEAIRLTARASAAPEQSLSDADVARAAHIREVWKKALVSVQAYAAARKKEPIDPNVWYETFRLGAAMAAAHPFPSLPPLWEVVDPRDTVDPSSFDGEGGYGHDKDTHCWRLGDRLLLSLAHAAGDDETLQRLIQLFLFHEYLHEHNALTKYTAQEVGSYPNSLEHIDYAADLYALLHQLGWAMIYDTQVVATHEAQCQFLAEQIDLILRSFWAFDQPFPRDEWQVRRLRRYLNWFWRHVQVKRAAPNLAAALAALARRPAIELAGMRQRVAGRRILASTIKRLPGEQLSLAVVLEDERLMRISNSVVTNLEELLTAFRTGNHKAIQQFFNAVYEEAKNWGSALPRLRDKRAILPQSARSPSADQG